MKVAPCAAVPKPEKIRVGVALPGALSVEIGDGGAVGLAGHEHKGVVAAAPASVLAPKVSNVSAPAEPVPLSPVPIR